MKALLDFIRLNCHFSLRSLPADLSGPGACHRHYHCLAIHFNRAKGTFDKQQWVVLLIKPFLLCGTLLCADDIYLRLEVPPLSRYLCTNTFLVSAAIK